MTISYTKALWSVYIPPSKAHKVATALKKMGYTTATADNCSNYAVSIAEYFEPGDFAAREKILETIDKLI